MPFRSEVARGHGLDPAEGSAEVGRRVVPQAGGDFLDIIVRMFEQGAGIIHFLTQDVRVQGCAGLLVEHAAEVFA